MTDLDRLEEALEAAGEGVEVARQCVEADAADQRAFRTLESAIWFLGRVHEKVADDKRAALDRRTYHAREALRCSKEAEARFHERHERGWTSPVEQSYPGMYRARVELCERRVFKLELAGAGLPTDG